jgi:methyl-accepting chemotaxis protein
MRLSKIQTGTKIIGAFAAVSAAIVVICAVALWRMQAADSLTRDLVDSKLASQQLTAELLGVARLNGVRTGAIARSDSLEAGDYFQSQLTQGDKIEAALAARLDMLASSPEERRLADQARSARRPTWPCASRCSRPRTSARPRKSNNWHRPA